MLDNWIDKHSVNCFKCGTLVDERECMPGKDGEGSICPTCQLVEPRPVDMIVDGRREAILSSRCLPMPIGCGGPAPYRFFKDDASRAEYRITGLCQNCQDYLERMED